MKSKPQKPQSEVLYFVKKTKKAFAVIEKGTDLVIKTCSDHNIASKYKDRLNKRRAGFQGFTPIFFAEKAS